MSKRKKHGPRVPLAVRGGIRSQGTRSATGRPWWGKRWILILESLRLGARLGRGRTYAAAGQIAALSLTEGEVSAVVQGGAQTPYQVTITFGTLPDEARTALAAALATRPDWLGRLLVNDLPPEVEVLFREQSTALFPERRNDWSCHCTCPDWAKPCKHAAAVLFLLGEAIEREPMLLLELRGLDRQDVIPGTETVTTKSAPAGTKGAQTDAETNAAAFWGDGWRPTETFGPAPGRSVLTPLATRLGPLPFWRGQERFREILEHVYERAGPMAMHIWSGDPPATWRPVKPPPPSNGFVLRRHRLRVDNSL